MTKPLADPMAARDHARAMAGTKGDTGRRIYHSQADTRLALAPHRP